MTRTFKLLTVAALAATGAFVAAAPAAYAEKPAVYTSARSNLAVGGYDTVSFFSGQPAKGQKEFSTSYNGAEWRFATAENLAAFEANPAAYAPQYGGYCAWAVAQGALAKGDPDYYAVVDRKLYLNFNASVQADWNEDRAGFIAVADANWPGILAE